MIDYHRLKSRRFAPIEQPVTARESILYALGVGVGGDPDDQHALRFIYENGLQPLPTYGTVLAYPGVWIAESDTGIDWRRALNGEYSVQFHRLPMISGRAVGRLAIEEIVDKGPGRGALIYTRREVSDGDTGETICVVRQTTFCRGDGGFGGPSGPVKPVRPVPATACDMAVTTNVPVQAHLIYRLSGDPNPLHVDPAVARSAGFARPILHGGATYGFVGYALLKALCGGEPARLRQLDVRFSAPVYPGETIETSIWRLGEGRAAFRSQVVGREAIALDNGYVEFQP
ncbi:MAG: MaoC/PaaZ C-terminal domain-containing protein [Reyranellaceae bacterium]